MDGILTERLNAKIPAELNHRLNACIPRGLKSELIRIILEQLADDLEKDGPEVIGRILAKKYDIKVTNGRVNLRTK